MVLERTWESGKLQLCWAAVVPRQEDEEFEAAVTDEVRAEPRSDRRQIKAHHSGSYFSLFLPFTSASGGFKEFQIAAKYFTYSGCVPGRLHVSARR